MRLHAAGLALALVGCSSSASSPAIEASSGGDAGVDASPVVAADAAPLPPCTPRSFFVDADGDGHGGATPVSACDAPANAVASSDDCDDHDPLTYPGEPTFFATPRANGTYDYDCSGANDPQTPEASCQWQSGTSCLGTSGFYAHSVNGTLQGGSPPCGQPGIVATCEQEVCAGSGSGEGCVEGSTCGVGDTSGLPSATQACR